MEFFAAAFGKPQAILTKEAFDEKCSSKEGDSQELSQRGKVSTGEPLRQRFINTVATKVALTLIKSDDNCAERRNESRRSVPSKTLSARVGSFSGQEQNRRRGMILPFEPHSIAFDEIRYAVDMPQVH